MNKKVVMFTVGLLALGAIIYFVFIKKDPYAILGKKAYGNLGKDYVSARANAIQHKNETFQIGGKTYLTETGKAAI